MSPIGSDYDEAEILEVDMDASFGEPAAALDYGPDPTSQRRYDDALEDDPDDGFTMDKKGLRVSRTSIREWHAIMAHTNAKTLRRTLAARGLRAYDDDGGAYPYHCDTCAVANARKKHVGTHGMRQDKQATKPGEWICADVFFLRDCETFTASRRIFVWVDDVSGYVGVAPYSLSPHDAERYQLAGVLARVIGEVRRLSGYTGIINLHTDRGSDEFNSHTEKILSDLGCVQTTGAAYHSNTNPKAEVWVRILRDRARSLMIEGSLPPPFTYSMIRHSAEVGNDLVGEDGLTPRMRMTGDLRPHTGTFDRVPGSLCVSYIAHNPGSSKQAQRGSFMIYVGRGAMLRQVGFLVYCGIARRFVVTPSVRFIPGAYTHRRFPFAEGLFLKVVNDARKALRSGPVYVQPYDKVLPNGQEANEFISRNVMVRKEKGKGYDTGVITSCRYAHSSFDEDLVFDVLWSGDAGSTRASAFRFDELAPMLVDDSRVEAMFHLHAISRETAFLVMDDGTRSLTAYLAAKEVDLKRYKKGQLNETTWSCVTAAIRDAPTHAIKRKWEEAVEKEIDRLFVKEKVFAWTDKKANDVGPMRLNFPAKLKKEGDLHNEEKLVYKVRVVGGTSKKEIEKRYGEPIGGWDTYAATIAHPALLLFFAMCVERGYYLWCLDVNGAYLNALAPRDNLIYRPPDCVPCPDRSKPYLRPLKNIYGWAEAGRAWYLFLLEIVEHLGFVAGDRTCTWLVRKRPTGDELCGTVVDDCVFGMPTEETWVALLIEIRAYVTVDAGPLETFIGITCHYDRERGILKLSQTHLIETAMTRFGVNAECRSYKTPMETGAVVSVNDSPQVPNSADVLTMQSMLGTFQYIRLTRPEITTAIINLLARVAKNPSKGHLAMATRVLCYLARTRDVPLVFSRGDWQTPDGTSVKSGQMICFVDASFADSGVEERMKSRHGYAIMRAGAAFASKSALQTLTAGSSCQAEVVGLYMSSIEIEATLQTLIRLGMPHEGPVLVMEDNQAAMSVMGAAGTSSGSNSRHFLMKYFYTADLQVVASGAIKLVKVHTSFQLGDGFTKPLPCSTHELHRHYLLGLHALTREEITALGLPYFDPPAASQ